MTAGARSLRTRLAVVLATIVALGLLANEAWLVMSARQRLRERLETSASLFASLAAEPVCSAYDASFESGYFKFRQVVRDLLALAPDVTRPPRRPHRGRARDRPGPLRRPARRAHRRRAAGRRRGAHEMAERLEATRAERERLIEELERRNAELERFTYTVSHDRRSPFVTVRGFVDLLEKDVATGAPERVAADLARIRGATSTMESLLRERLEQSRVGRVNPPERVSPDELARQAIALLHGRLRAANVQVRFGPGCPSCSATASGSSRSSKT